MTREKDYLDAVVIVALSVMFGPILFILLIYAITGSGFPPNLEHKDYIMIDFIGEMFSFSGIIMLIYVFYRRVKEWWNKSRMEKQESETLP
jgi:hypothetical protein